MFFTQELLASRDSGFGLLWLAATLGSKSAFKKLPKRSILTADISLLCNLIAEPLEPLALRLSSNLLVGVARVYKVKQDIFLNDVSSCFTSLKKVVQEFRSSDAMDACLQMVQGSVRPSAITLSANPKGALAMDFDALVADWDEYLNIGDQHTMFVNTSDDEDFGPKDPGLRKKRKMKANPDQAEHPRAELYTLTEDHDHILSASFDISFHDSGNGMFGPSSSQAVDFRFDDNFFALSDGLDVGGLADELAQELGWETSTRRSELDLHLDGPVDIQMDLNHAEHNLDQNFESNIQVDGMKKLKRKGDSRVEDTDNVIPDEMLTHPTDTPCYSRQSVSPLLNFMNPVTSEFSRMLLTQEDAPALVLNVAAEQYDRANAQPKIKKTRLLLDPRTELTDDELKTARAQYLHAQYILRRDMKQKQIEKQSGKFLEERVWGVPACICASPLADFWQENFKIQVEARTGMLHIHSDDSGHPRKRRRFDPQEVLVAAEELCGLDSNVMTIDPTDEFKVPAAQDNIRSSEEPGQGRQISREASILGDFGFDLGTQNVELESQKSSMFPWDNAGGSSSSGVFGMPGNLPVDHIGIRSRGSTQSRGESSLIPSHVGSLAGGPGFSPAPVKRTSQGLEEDYEFEVNMNETSATVESQRSELNFISLEKNSLNFLEYVKMQSYSLPSSATDLTFDTVVPQTASTRHVAASAFYHCLVASCPLTPSSSHERPFAPQTDRPPRTTSYHCVVN